MSRRSVSALLAPRPAARDGQAASEPPRLCEPSRTGGDGGMTLAEARAAIMQDRVEEARLRGAIQALRHGDWLDLQRAELLDALLQDPATAPAGLDTATAPTFGEIMARIDWGDVLGGVAVFALLALGIWVAWGLGVPTGGAELTGGVR